MTAHPPAPTPTPWTLIWHGNEKYPYPLSVMSQDGTEWVARDGQVSSEANGRLIVTAVNAHAPLVEACWRLIESADDYSTWGSEAALVALEEASERAREALASAEGGTLRAEDSR